jgi:hypothetical protein
MPGDEFPTKFNLDSARAVSAQAPASSGAAATGRSR